jgi:hypothetical protein
MLVVFPPCATYEEAVGWQTYYYDQREFPYDSSEIAQRLNAHFNVEHFRAGKPRAAEEGAVAIRWPKHRAQRKPIKMELQAGVLLTDL